MSNCTCTMAIRVNGDGCRYCQPQEYIDRLTDWINEARDEIAALAKERKDLECQLSEAESKLPRWIPVSERLPKPSTMCLVMEEGQVEITYFTPKSLWVSEVLYKRKVTHWMPLPDAPETERKGK